MGKAVDGLVAALERARAAYDWERGLMHDRPAMAAARNRLRKASIHKMVDGQATEILKELDWWSIPRPRDQAEAIRAKSHLLLEMEQRAGAPGDAALRAAGFALLSWWCETRGAVTATKVNVAPGRDEGDYKPSAAVAFLAEQLPTILPSLGEGDPARPDWTPALDAAYTIARKWLEQEPPHWTDLDPGNGPIGVDFHGNLI
jgi:hypothetical protein